MPVTRPHMASLSPTSPGTPRERHRRVAVTTASTVVPKLLNLAILLIGARFVAVALPPEFGVWLLLITASGLLGFADLGLGNGLLNEVAAAHGRDDLEASVGRSPIASAALLIVPALLVGGFSRDDSVRALGHRLLDVQGTSAQSVSARVAVFVVATAIAVAFAAAPRIGSRCRPDGSTTLGVRPAASSVWRRLSSVQRRGASLPVLVGAALVGPPLVAVADTMVLSAGQRPELRPGR